MTPISKTPISKTPISKTPISKTPISKTNIKYRGLTPIERAEIQRVPIADIRIVIRNPKFMMSLFEKNVLEVSTRLQDSQFSTGRTKDFMISNQDGSLRTIFKRISVTWIIVIDKGITVKWEEYLKLKNITLSTFEAKNLPIDVLGNDSFLFRSPLDSTESLFNIIVPLSPLSTEYTSPFSRSLGHIGLNCPKYTLYFLQWDS